VLEDGKGGSGAAFVLNAVTYLLSAFFISRADVPGHEARPQAPNLLAALGLTDLAEGARFVAREPGVRLMLFAKAGWSLAGGGALMLYTVFGERVFPIGKGAASGIGLLYAARGVGALLGPTAARVWKGDSEPALERAIGFGFPLMVAAYLLLAGAPSIGVAAAAVVLAHIAASVIWTFSTSLLNLRVPDRLKGRAFALDAAITTVSPHRLHARHRVGARSRGSIAARRDGRARPGGNRAGDRLATSSAGAGHRRGPRGVSCQIPRGGAGLRAFRAVEETRALVLGPAARA
jgi:hypothetical protein